MLRFTPLVLLLAGVGGLIGCQPQGVSSGPASVSTPSDSANAESAASPVAVGESAVKTAGSDGASPTIRESPAEPVSTVVAAEAKIPAGTPSDSLPTSPSTAPTPIPATSPTSARSSSAEEAGYVDAAAPGAPAELPQKRTFRTEGAEQALRITYDDLDLLKWLQMDPVSPDCVEKMPEWLRGLNGKKVRLRGFMKPHEISTGFRRFIFVKDTGLCCFGPAGKIYDLIQVTLQKGTTTDYIELTPFDVIGTFRIEVAALDDTQEVYELFHIDDAKIVRK